MSFSVSYPADKYDALKFHVEEKGGSMEDCMAESLEDWYRRKVPSGIRKYLDAKYEKEFGAPPEPLNIPAPEPEGSMDVPSWES